MKKETKRYSLVEYLGKTQRIINNEVEYAEFIKYIKKLNQRVSSKYYYGNIGKEPKGGKLLVTIRIYNRLTLPRTISDLDAECSDYVSVKEMLNLSYNDKIKHINPDVYISYFETKNAREKDEESFDVGVRALPLFFECDQKYFNESYIKKCLISFANDRDIGFFKDLCNEFCLNHDVAEAIESLRKTIDNVCYWGADSFMLSVDAMRLYHQLIYERDASRRVLRDKDGKIETSHRRVRDFGSFIRDYNMPQRKKVSSIYYNVPQNPKNIGKELTQEQMQLKIKL